MKERERILLERRELDQRAFANFDADTGAIVQAWFCQIPPAVPSGRVAVFENVHWSNAIPDYRVDLKSLHTVDGDHDHCELVPRKQMDA